MALGLATVSLAWPDTTQPIETGHLPAGLLRPHDDSADNGKQIQIGVLAKRGRAHCLYQWGPTAAYLSQQIPESSFSILPLDFDQKFNAVQNQTVDFIFANPSFYVELEVRFGVTRITRHMLSLRGWCLPGRIGTISINWNVWHWRGK
jgi:hypothetical protein